MLEPYTPGKIPVLMVHGLWSSPLTWMEMFNDLRSMREIRDNYQFWFYEYPTGQPFWDSAAQLRDDLAKTREVLDPAHAEPALDQMVLVGHSMGGLLSKLQVVDSGDAFWRTVSDEPLEKLKLPDETKQRPGPRVLLPAEPVRAARDYDRHAAPWQQVRQRHHALVGAENHHLAQASGAG